LSSEEVRSLFAPTGAVEHRRRSDEELIELIVEGLRRHSLPL
jgi:hypothetical protein